MTREQADLERILNEAFKAAGASKCNNDHQNGSPHAADA